MSVDTQTPPSLLAQPFSWKWSTTEDTFKGKLPNLEAALNQIIEHKQITTLFQPIIHLATGRIFGYETLSRGPETSPLHMPELMFKTARNSGHLFDLDRTCREASIVNFKQLGIQEKLFLNIDPLTMMEPDYRPGATVELLRRLGIQGTQVVIELTEQSRVENIFDLKRAVTHYRQMGFSIAMDDLSAGYSNLQLMAELRPEFIKLDKYFVRKLTHDRVAREFVKTIVNLAKGVHCAVIAEGIETPEDLCEIKKLNVDYAQGYLFGKPATEPDTNIYMMSDDPCSLCADREGDEDISALYHRRIVPCMPDESAGNVLKRFRKNPELIAIPVVTETQQVLGLVLREHLMQSFTHRFAHELHGNRPIQRLMYGCPIIASQGTTLNDLSGMVTNRSANHIYDPVIIENHDGYLGLVYIHDLLDHMTKSRVEQAMESNPLTRLPGNAAIEREVTNRLATAKLFFLCYIDLDNFKAFNDRYGYQRGDDMLRMLSEILKQDQMSGDFLGHIGGDDFIILLEYRRDWEVWLHARMDDFLQQVQELYDAKDILNGGIISKNRTGKTQKFPIASLSIGALPCMPGLFKTHLETSEVAVELKCKAKKTQGNSLVIDQRTYQSTDTSVTGMSPSCQDNDTNRLQLVMP